MRRLIVNADDFGLHVAVNQGIQAAHSEGIVSSASLMAGGAAFDDAVRIAKHCPELGVGVHLTLVGARPVLPAAEVPSLVVENGDFYGSYPVFLKRFLSGKIRLAEVERELAAQFDWLAFYRHTLTAISICMCCRESAALCWIWPDVFRSGRSGFRPNRFVLSGQRRLQWDV